MVEVATATNQIERSANQSVVDVLVFLSERGASTEVIALAMRRAGISAEVACILAQCVASMRKSPHALQTPTSPRQIYRSGRAAEIILQKLIGLVILAGIIWGFGITLGFAVGMEMGFAQGVEDGLDRIGLFLSLQGGALRF